MVAVLAGLAAALLEFGWYATMSGIPAERVLLSNLDFSYSVRPMWFVIAICALPLAALLARSPAGPAGLPRAARRAT